METASTLVASPKNMHGFGRSILISFKFLVFIHICVLPSYPVLNTGLFVCPFLCLVAFTPLKGTVTQNILFQNMVPINVFIKVALLFFLLW